ncbi:MAG: acetylxylan esterase [Victivallaceae bacterium]|nr:acetylxylan esterase [Victivallaceae bacterium]
MMTWKNALLFFVALAVSGCGCPGSQSYLIEAEEMDDLGSFETERGDCSGNALIRAAGTNIFAKGVYEIPEEGDYTFFLRDVSFGDNQRTLDCLVDRKKIGSGGDAPGAVRPALEWCKLGSSHLTRGAHEIMLQSTGANVRADALLLVKGKVPPLPDDSMPEKYQRLCTRNGVRHSGEVKFNCMTERAPFGAYHCKEAIVFSIHPTLDDKPIREGQLFYTLAGDDGKKSEGIVKLTGNPVKVTTTLDTPGFVRLTFTLHDADGKLFLGAGKFDSCAGADEEKISQIAEPEDFDAFWAKQKARLAAVPLKPEFKEIAGRDPENFRSFEVTIPAPGNAPVTGFLVVPRDAKAKTLPANVAFQGYGVHMPSCAFPQKGCIFFEINAHGMPLAQTRESIKELAHKLNRYALDDTADPENAYFCGMALRVLRALEFVRTLPEWNGKDLMVSGGSQGGLQSLWAAGLDDKVSFCQPYIPWCCNLGSETLGFMPKTWGVTYTEGARYFDAANFAKRIKCPVEITRAGLGDFICPPSGVARMYHNLKCPKKITWFVNNAHSNPPSPRPTFATQSDDFKVPAAFEKKH